MSVPICILLCCFGFAAVAQDAPPDPSIAIPPLLQAGDGFLLRGEYEAAQQAFTKAWEFAQQTPPDNPVRYDVCKRLASIRAAGGEFADAVNWLQQAISWRESILAEQVTTLTF